MSEYDWSGIHRRMLNDSIRTEAFRQAIENTVKPGDVVADVGAGTGILSLFAARAGAARVYAIERTPTIEYAKAIAKANGFQDKIKFLWVEAPKAELGEKVDVIVSEWLGNGGVEENMLPAVMSVRDRFLKPDGVMIPGTMTAFLAPVESTDAFDFVDYFTKDVYGFDYTAMRKKSLEEQHLTRFTPEQLLAGGEVVATFDIHTVQKPFYKTTCIFTLERDGHLHGLTGWFDSVIAGDVKIRTGPNAPETHWYHVYYPIREAVPVRLGNMVRATIEAAPGETNVVWSWKIEVFDGQEALDNNAARATFSHANSGY
jgi:SAM-dependent methyltransferase